MEDEEPELTETIKKQLCSEPLMKPEENKPKINIFETNLCINHDPITSTLDDATPKNKNVNTTVELENMTKKMIPDYNFDTFGTKDFKKQAQNYTESNKSKIFQEKYDQDSSENEEMAVDDQCRTFSLEISHETRNPLTKTPEQELNRRKLPIYMKESEIIDSINNNFITIICGETGSGS